MDDMKRLIEKYKQELMEYSRASSPQQRREFPQMPEMIEEKMPAEPKPAKPKPTEPKPTEPKPAEPKPAEPKPPEPKPTEPKLAEPKPAAPKSTAPKQPAPSHDDETAAIEGEENRVVFSYYPEESETSAEGNDMGIPTEDTAAQDGYNGFSGAAASAPGSRRMPPEENPGESAGEPTRPPEETNELAGVEDAPEGHKPRVIGYVDGDRDLLAAYDSLFAEMIPRANSEISNTETIPSFSETQQEITENSKPRQNAPERIPPSGVTDNAGLEPLPDTPPIQSGSAEQAERLTEQPVSGTEPDEQLTGRLFENNTPPQNSPSDIQPLENVGEPFEGYKEQEYSSFDEFAALNPKWGSMQFRIYTARGALPVEGAQCRITKVFGGQEQTLFTLITDSSGKTVAVSLPAPPKELSQTSGGKIQPYALYDASVTAKGFATVKLLNIPVFEGVLSLQRTAMVPDVGNGEQVIDENEQAMKGGV